MRFTTVLCIFFYTIVFFLIGGFLISLAIGWIDAKDVYGAIEYLQLSLNSRIITSATGLFLIIISILFAQLILGRMEKEKTIAFNAPTGQVTIALSAVEDLIKRLAQNFSEIKEMRPNVIASKRGVEVNLRITLQSEVNIPDLTNHLQETIKSRIQEMLGIEEQITVRVHVSKIITYGEKKKSEPAASEEAVPPFSGYRRT